MRFWIYGFDGTSKAAREPLFLEAESEEAARAEASALGMQVEEVELVKPRIAQVAPATDGGRSLVGLRRALLPITGLLLLGAGVAVGWFAARRGMLESEQKDVVKKPGNEVALEEVKEATRALQLAGFEQAFVYRWRGGALEGHLVLEKAGKPERVELGPRPKGKVDPSYEGLLVIAVRPKVPGLAGQECIWVMSEEFDHDGFHMVDLGATSSGRLPDLAGGGGGGAGGSNAFYKLNLPGGAEWEFFKLKVVKRE